MEQTYGYGKGDFHLDSLRARQERQFDRDLRYFVGFMPSVKSNEILSSLDNVVKEKAVLHANLNLKKKSKLRGQLKKLKLGDIPNFVQKNCQIGSMHLKKKLRKEERAQEGWDSQKLGKTLSKTKIETLGRNFLEFIVSAEQRFPLLFAEGQKHEFFKFKAKKAKKLQMTGASCQKNVRNMLSKLKLKERRMKKQNQNSQSKLWRIKNKKYQSSLINPKKTNNFVKNQKLEKKPSKNRKIDTKNSIMSFESKWVYNLDQNNGSPISIPKMKTCNTEGCFEIARKPINSLQNIKKLERNRSFKNKLSTHKNSFNYFPNYGSHKKFNLNTKNPKNIISEKENHKTIIKTGSAFFFRKKVFKRKNTKNNIKKKGLKNSFSIKAIRSQEWNKTSY